MIVTSQEMDSEFPTHDDLELLSSKAWKSFGNGRSVSMEVEREGINKPDFKTGNQLLLTGSWRQSPTNIVGSIGSPKDGLK